MPGIEAEIWKDIPGYEGLYQVSRCGKVKRLAVTDRIPSNSLLSKDRVLDNRSYNGYYVLVGLRKDNRVTTHPVHRLVASALIPNPCNKPHVNHKDLDKTNNHVDNLEWCTPKENTQHWVDFVKAYQELFSCGKRVKVKKTNHQGVIIKSEGVMKLIDPPEAIDPLGWYYYEQLELIQ